MKYALGVLAAGVLLCLGSQASLAKSKQEYCKKYGKDALRQQFENVKYNCGFGGFKWHSNYNSHYGHCMKFSIQHSNPFWTVFRRGGKVSLRSNDHVHREGKLRVCRRNYKNKPAIRVTRSTRFCFRSTYGGYIVAEGNKRDIRANRRQCRGWEKHALIDINGGTLQHGDKVYVRTFHNRFWSGVPTRLMMARGKNAWAIFTIRKLHKGKQIKSGDLVTFQNRQGRYVQLFMRILLRVYSSRRIRQASFRIFLK